MLKLETMEQIIDFVVAREQYAYELYKSMTKREVYSNVAELCEQLAEDELEHKQWLQDDFMRAEHVSLPVDVSDYVVHNDQKTVFMDSQEFLNFAVKKEEIAMNLYKGVAKETTNCQCRDVFLALAMEEEKHKELLQEKLNNLLK